LGGLGGVEVAEDGDVGILVETGIWLKTGFGVHATAEDAEIMPEEADAVFKAGAGEVMLEVMGTTAGHGLHGTVVLAGLGPAGWEMVGIEFVVALTVTRRADNDAFAALAALMGIIDGTAYPIEEIDGFEIGYRFGVRGGVGRKRTKTANSGRNTVFYDVFEVSGHSL